MEPSSSEVPESGTRLPEHTVSIVRLERDEWIATNVDDPTVSHHAASLTDLLAAHRHAVAFRIGRALVVRYLVGNEDTADRIDRIRAAGAHVAGLRREANHAEAAIRADRVALMRELAGLHVAPGEIAQIINVPTTAVPKDLGTDRDAVLGRRLFGHTSSPTDSSGPERLF